MEDVSTIFDRTPETAARKAAKELIKNLTKNLKTKPEDEEVLGADTETKAE